MKNIRILFENFRFLVVKFSIYLNRRVFVMSHFRSDTKKMFLNVFPVCAKTLFISGYATEDDAKEFNS